MTATAIVSKITSLRIHSQTPQMVLNNNTSDQPGTSNSTSSIEEFESISDEQHTSSQKHTTRSRRKSLTITSTQRVVPPNASRASNIFHGIKKRGLYKILLN